MTDAQIMAEFLRIEAAMNRTPQGADHQHILRTVAAMSGRDVADVRRVVLDRNFSTAN